MVLNLGLCWLADVHRQTTDARSTMAGTADAPYKVSLPVGGAANYHYGAATHGTPLLTCRQ